MLLSIFGPDLLCGLITADQNTPYAHGLCPLRFVLISRFESPPATLNFLFPARANGPDFNAPELSWCGSG